jgi:hypothetical protein
MKKCLTLLVCVGLLSTSLMARGHHRHHNHNKGNSVAQTQQAVVELTKEQEEALLFMYQEEKVARDVYTVLGKKWKLRVFKNIQRSEQRHMDAIRSLLEKYDLPIPAIDDEIGSFDNEDLQALYNQLVDLGLVSKEEALKVGVTVEETDIADLEERMQNAPDDVKKVFSHLLRASQNHLRAFNRNLDRLK